MTQISNRPIRLRCDLASANHARDVRTGNAPTARRGESLALQIGAFLGADILADVGNWETVAVQIRALASNRELDPAGELAASATVSGPFTAPAESAWDAGTGQHAEITLSAEQMLIAAGEYGFTISATTSDDPAGTLVLAFGRLKVIETGLGDGDAPPTVPEGYYNKEEADARFARLANLKHGSAALASGQSDHAVAFAAAFASAPSCIVATLEIPAGGALVVCGIKAITAAGFTFRTGAPVPASGYKVHWRAVL